MSSELPRKLRSATTDAERRLWSILRGRRLAGYKFRRQHPVGPFILDFACIVCRLAVEADGGQHAESSDDHRRTEWLAEHGWRVLRFWNNDILAHPEAVADAIRQELDRLREKPHH